MISLEAKGKRQVQNTGQPGHTGQIESKEMAMQRVCWVKDGVLGEWLCTGTLGLKMVFLGKMAMERGDLWVKNLWLSKMIFGLKMGFGGKWPCKGIFGLKMGLGENSFAKGFLG